MVHCTDIVGSVDAEGRQSPAPSTYAVQANGPFSKNKKLSETSVCSCSRRFMTAIPAVHAVTSMRLARSSVETKTLQNSRPQRDSTNMTAMGGNNGFTRKISR